MRTANSLQVPTSRPLFYIESEEIVWRWSAVQRKDKAVTEARYIDVGRSIREARKEYGLKQKELAETVSMDPQYLNQIRKQDLV